MILIEIGIKRISQQFLLVGSYMPKSPENYIVVMKLTRFVHDLQIVTF